MGKEAKMSKPYSVFANYYDYLMANVDYDAWTDRIANQIKTHNPKARILVDLACGTGNISNRLAKKGYSVTGIDISEEMLMIAQDKAHEQHLRIQYLKQDMVKFATHRKAEVITAICDGLNYLTEDQQLKLFFANAWKQLMDQGLLILDLSTPYKYQHVLAERTIAELDEQVSFIWDNTFDSETQRLTFDIAFFVPEGEEGLYRRMMEHHVQKSHSLETLKEAMAGLFTIASIVDGESGGVVEEISERWLMVLRKI